MDLPRTQKAIIALQDGTLGISQDVGLPRLEDDMILVKTAAVAINPVDAKMTGSLVTPGGISGTDFAGTVVAIGSKAAPPFPVSVGDRVCGAVHGMHRLTPRIGAFAEYVGAHATVTMKIPTKISFEGGASLGSGIGTVRLALFQSLQVPGYPTEPATSPREVLVYGGSTATGTMAIQILKLCGLKPIATCSPKNFELVRSFGADAVFDYRSPSSVTDILAYTRKNLKYVLDCIAEHETTAFCYACIGRAGGKYTALEPTIDALHNRPSVKPDWVFGPRLLGKPIGLPPPFESDADEDTHNFAMKWFQAAQQLLDEGKIKLHPLRQMPDGFGGVIAGVNLLGQKQISGEKLVCRVP
ncbi:putative secondary metabolism biosynthetic enzyme [Myotisia sp. PD_48]|nr:putative secondary metabolism biosynthetic enzyme [Myotisia sp. PD_48]